MQVAADHADAIVTLLRAHASELRAAGLLHLSLFGSVARGEAGPTSDIDLAATFAPGAEMDLFRLVALERRLGEILERKADLVAEPIGKERLRLNVERDRLRVF